MRSLVYDREKKETYEIEQYGGNALKFLYNNALGRIILKIVILPVTSKISGVFNNSKLSKSKIEKFIKTNKIDMSEFEKQKYKSFNDFFTRQKSNVEICKDKKSFISPADSKLLLYKITNDLKVKIKDSEYLLKDLVGESDLEEFSNGNCLVFRLSVDDYHRYCFVDNGSIKSSYSIKGKLHTVSSISKDYKIYKENSRVCSFLKTENFDEIIMIEVGALLVGKIKNHNIQKFKKGQEKGYFELGGSTIVILTKDNIKIDEDIIQYSNKNIETKVKYGERIGEAIC